MNLNYCNNKEDINSELSPDTRWTAVFYVESHKEYCERYVIDFFFRDGVHKDILSSFNVIKKLLVHAYFEYEFFDVASVKAMLTFEMALKLRYAELNPEQKQDKSLRELINWFMYRNYFEHANTNFFEHWLKVRNHYAHPEQHSFAGAGIQHHILNVVDLINDLYHNVDLRIERQDELKNLNQTLRRISKKDGVLKIAGNEFLVVTAFSDIINNLGALKIYSLNFIVIESIDDRVYKFKLISLDINILDIKIEEITGKLNETEVFVFKRSHLQEVRTHIYNANKQAKLPHMIGSFVQARDNLYRMSKIALHRS